MNPIFSRQRELQVLQFSLDASEAGFRIQLDSTWRVVCRLGLDVIEKVMCLGAMEKAVCRI